MAGEAQSYVTGHRPKETYFQMVSRLNASAHIGDMPDRPKGTRRRKTKLDKLLEQLSPEQIQEVLSRNAH